jgi:hypothetical protein
MEDVLVQPGFGPKPAVSECHIIRFGELDAQIQAEEQARHTPTPSKKSKRRQPTPALPAAVRKEITRLARELNRQHRSLFMADPKLKDRAARLLRSLLLPKRKRGRPGIDSVTKAIQLRARFRRQHPGERPEQIWKRVYPEAIPGYAGMNPHDQKHARQVLRERVRWRRRKRCQAVVQYSKI